MGDREEGGVVTDLWEGGRCPGPKSAAFGCSGHLAGSPVWRGRMERERGGAGWGTGWLGDKCPA